MSELAQAGEWDYLVIESTGISEPLPVAQTFVMALHGCTPTGQQQVSKEVPKEATGKDKGGVIKAPTPELRTLARLDTMVTVVDCVTFFAKLAKLELIRDQPDAAGDEAEERTLSDLMVDQVLGTRAFSRSFSHSSPA